MQIDLWHPLIIGGVICAALAVAWLALALCRAAADADRAPERMDREIEAMLDKGRAA